MKALIARICRVMLLLAVVPYASGGDVDMKKLRKTETISEELRQHFQVGMTEEQVVSVFKEKFGVSADSIDKRTLEKPLKVDKRGEEYLAQFSLNAPVHEWKSWKSLFTPNYATAHILFDVEGRAIDIEGRIAFGPH